MTMTERYNERADVVRVETLGKQILDRLDADPGRKYDDLAKYMAQLRHYPPLVDQAECDRLFHLFRHGATEQSQHEARDLIIYRNIRLVLSIALRLTGRGLPLLDMLQEGVFGLMTAIQKFNPEFGWRFSTYASHWIRQAIGRALADIGDSHVFRIPVHAKEKVEMVRRAIAAFSRREGHLPNELELFEYIQSLDSKAAKAMRLGDVIECMGYVYNRDAVHLDAPVSDESGDSYGEVFVGDLPRTETIVEARQLLAEYRAAFSRIEEIIAQMPPRDAMVLRLRFGIGDFEEMTLEEVGERYGFTRERARQIEAKALEAIEAQIGVSGDQIIEIMKVIDELAKIAAAI